MGTDGTVPETDAEGAGEAGRDADAGELDLSTSSLARLRAKRDAQDAHARRTFKRAVREAENGIPLEQPTADEARNGWTAESLRLYRIDQAAAQAVRIDPKSLLRRTRQTRANKGGYRPLRWRG